MAQNTSRRGAFAVLGGLVAVATGWQLYLGRPEKLSFTSIEGAPGWQIAELGDVSASPSDAVLLGLDDEAIDPLPASELRQTVYPRDEKLAVFSDAFCPHCRRLVPALASAYPGQVHYHALPFFGAFSERVARAAVAAEMQGDKGAMHILFHATPIRPTPSFFKRTAESQGLNGDQLLVDMESAAVTDRLLQTRRAAERLGIWGTPAIAIGQKVVMGSVAPDEVANL